MEHEVAQEGIEYLSLGIGGLESKAEQCGFSPEGNRGSCFGNSRMTSLCLPLSVVFCFVVMLLDFDTKKKEGELAADMEKGEQVYEQSELRSGSHKPKHMPSGHLRQHLHLDVFPTSLSCKSTVPSEVSHLLILTAITD